MKSVFGSGSSQAVVDEREFDEFSPVIMTAGSVELNEGVITFGGKGSVYAPCDGTVSSVVVAENGLYTIEITHSENFKTIFSGLEFAYAGQGDSVFGNIPVGYMDGDGATMCFTDGSGAIISDYQLIDNSVVWAV